jgi:hypothetical protein
MVNGQWKLASADISPDRGGGKSGPLAWEVNSASDDRAQPRGVLSLAHPPRGPDITHSSAPTKLG